jgi:hypothetical protein
MNWQATGDRISDWYRRHIKAISAIPFICLGMIVLLSNKLKRMASTPGKWK